MRRSPAAFLSPVRSLLRRRPAAGLGAAAMLLGLAGLDADVIAQTIIRSPGGGVMIIEEEIIEGGSMDLGAMLSQMQGEGGGGETDADGKPVKQPVDPQLLQQFQQLMLDRRPSSILKAWSSPEPKPAEEDPELALPEEPKEPAAPPAPAAEAPAQPTEGGDETAQPTSPDGAQAPASDAPSWSKTAPADAVVAGQPDAATAYAAAKAEYDKAKAEYDVKKAEIEAKRTARRFEIFQRDVTLGRWDRVEAFLETFGESSAEQIYPMFLDKLAIAPPTSQQRQDLQQFFERNSFAVEDIPAIVGTLPGTEKFDKDNIVKLPPLVALALDRGQPKESWLEVLRKEIARPEAELRIDRRMAARILAAQNDLLSIGEFLPTLEEAVQADDREALNLLARHNLAKFEDADKGGTPFLEQAWHATLAALATGEIEKEEKEQALRRAVSLAVQVRDELGDTWLEESFTARPERGMEVLATIGKQSFEGMVERANDTEFRLDSLKLLKSAVSALLAKAPERAAEWRETLGMLASVWRSEAKHSYENSEATSRGPRTRRDAYGNIYWMDYGWGYRSSPVEPLDPGDLLEIRPTDTWYEQIDPELRRGFDTTIAELYLKVNEEKLAFPYIEQLAVSDPKRANDLAKEFLEVWIKNNDPNSERNQTNIYMFNYGYNQRADGIPLTRSKQERSLKDLGEWIAKLRAVPGIELDTKLLVRAFTASHSAAEVYRIETMERVFGTLADLDADTLADMAQTMRTNLATTWRVPAIQQQAGTNRRQKDIEAEVQKGYAIAQEMLGRALQQHPESWRLQVARAAMVHDLNNYRNEIQKTSDFAELRRASLGLFEDAVERYVASIPDTETDDETVEAFEFWYHAALGASDVDAIDQEKVLARHEIPKIKAALEGITGAARERHIAKFANSLFTKLSNVNPAVKNRFLETGFEIVGEDHPQAREAFAVYQFYKDLVSEIEVVASVDGSSDVGTEPFGIKIDVTYTKEIERESGGFAKYLQNQANNVSYYYNYGRPPENYRDKFEESLRAALEEHFEVKSLTFNAEGVSSKAAEEFGWRRTPYAYALVQAKGPEVDRIPQITMDLDFLDVTGYVVLPVSSAVVPIDASAKAELRPFSGLEVTQVLDERKSAEGLLQVEIKARATGLLPPLEEIVDVQVSDFEVTEIDDQGVSVARFGDDEDSIQSERLWVVKMRAKPGVENATKFAFAQTKIDGAQTVFQRYDDADLISAEAVVDLSVGYGESDSSWWIWTLVGLVVALLAWLSWRALRARPSQAEAVGLRAPERITPFTVLGFLRELHASPRLGEQQRSELDATILRIERFYFDRDTRQAVGEQPDLGRITDDWLRRA